MKKILLLLLCLLFMTSCYDYSELNEIAIVNGLGIDYENDEYIVTVEIIKTTKSEEGNTVETNIITKKDKNIVQAFEKILQTSDKKIYMKHLSLLVLGDSLKEIGISTSIDYIIRDVLINNNYHVVETKNAEELLNIQKESISTIIGNTIGIITNQDKNNSVDFIASNLLNNRTDVVIPYVTIKDEDIELDKVAYFEEDKFKNTIDNKIYNFLMTSSNNTVFNTGDNTISIRNKKIKFKVEEDKIRIEVKGKALVKSKENDLDTETKESYRALEDCINTQIEKEILDFLKETYEENNADLLGFKNKYYCKYRKNRNKLDYEVKANITVNKNGASLRGVTNE